MAGARWSPRMVVSLSPFGFPSFGVGTGSCCGQAGGLKRVTGAREATREEVAGGVAFVMSLKLVCVIQLGSPRHPKISSTGLEAVYCGSAFS